MSASTALHIDWTRCRGRGMCTELLTGLGRDEWGYPLVAGGGSDLPIRTHDVEAADDAVALCPVLALSIRPARPTR
ncbi:MAG: ferredoxin [Acidobacteria bacterium]|nr:ferredoxin [Acidobacteriota bacterium]